MSYRPISRCHSAGVPLVGLLSAKRVLQGAHKADKNDRSSTAMSIVITPLTSAAIGIYASDPQQVLARAVNIARIPNGHRSGEITR